MSYNEGNKKNVDLSSLGSGSKQAILLFAYLLAFPNTVNLLDEPDAHLEVIRQSNIYDKISDIAKKSNSQLIIASATGMK
ncbi:MAG: ATP-binding protein [Saprospiraceae bacterium]|nr:ATP-binding protein [Saprospiraceae bacterium]